MRKKWTAGILAAILTLTITGTVFAGDTPSETLTVDAAVQYALHANTDYLNLLDTASLNNQGRNDTISSFTSGSIESWLSNNVQLMQYDAKLALQSANEALKKLSLQNTLTRYFMNIITAENALTLAQESLAIAKTDLSILNTKVRLGMVSQTSYNASAADYEKSLNDLATKEASIASAYIELNRLMGKPLDTRYTLELNFAYEAYGEVNLEKHISSAISKNPTVRQKQSDYDIASYKDSYAYAFTKSATGNIDEVNIAAVQAKRALEDARENLSLAIISSYNEIRNLEIQISTNQIELANMREQLAVKEAEWTLGKITALEVSKYRFQIAQLEETVRQQIYNHGLTVWQFEHPDVL